MVVIIVEVTVVAMEVAVIVMEVAVLVMEVAVIVMEVTVAVLPRSRRGRLFFDPKNKMISPHEVDWS